MDDKGTAGTQVSSPGSKDTDRLLHPSIVLGSRTAEVNKNSKSCAPGGNQEQVKSRQMRSLTPESPGTDPWLVTKAAQNIEHVHTACHRYNHPSRVFSPRTNSDFHLPLSAYCIPGPPSAHWAEHLLYTGPSLCTLGSVATCKLRSFDSISFQPLPHPD